MAQDFRAQKGKRAEMRFVLGIALSGILAFATVPAGAQWGNRANQEKGDVFGRDMDIPPISFFEHTGIFTGYASGDPADRSNSDITEMLGPALLPPSSGGIVITNAEDFIDESLFRGAFRHLTHTLTRVERNAVVALITQMKNRTDPIEYVSWPYYNTYLEWTRRDSNFVLDLDDIDRMRSDAVVEFAYAKVGFPIIRPNLFSTIVNSPDLFEALASSNALLGNPNEVSLIPRGQLHSMIPATAEPPEMISYDANNVQIGPNGVSSMTSISVYVSDTDSGPGGLELLQNGSVIAGNYLEQNSVSYLYTSADIAELGSLSDGQYTLRAIDQGGNFINSELIIRSVGPDDTKNKDQTGGTPDNSDCIVGTAIDPSGIASITISSPGYSQTTSFSCDPVSRSTSVVGKVLCPATVSTYTTTSTNCADLSNSSSTYRGPAPAAGTACLDDRPCGNFTPTANAPTKVTVNTAGSCGGCSLDDFCKQVSLSPLSSCRTSGGGLPFIAEYTAPCAQNFSYSIVNTTTTVWPTILQVNAGAGATAFFNDVVPPTSSVSHSGTVAVSQTGVNCPTSNTSNTITVNASYWGMAVTSQSFTDRLLAYIRQILASFPGSLIKVEGSEVIFSSSGTITFSLPNPSSILVSTASLAIYQFDGVDWTSAAVTSQSVSKDPSTSVISATGSIISSGYFALFFNGNDSSAPITSAAFQGTSYFFDGALFLSTDTFVVLTATDPAVNGYDSTVASITYRIDPTASTPFSIYSSSIPLPLGTHVFEYRSIDYAGNIETIQTATFTVTTGKAFRTSNTGQVPGILLNGYLGSGAKLEIESQAQNTNTLLISSVNRQGMIAIDNIGEVGIGVTPQATLSIGAASIGLQLRSGNSTSAVTSNQIALGYNGDYSMRHLMRTEHSTAAHGNKLDFLVWNTGAGSTTTVASLNALSLQGITTASGGSFHVQPVGEPDAEVEVSNGLSTGGGTMQRLQVVTPSSRRFKTDIKDLRAKDEDQALSEIAGLKHAKFRYLSRAKDGRLSEDPTQPLHAGLIYEDAPESIRDGKDALSTTERLVNVEMALKASMRRLEELQKRYDELKARRKTP